LKWSLFIALREPLSLKIKDSSGRMNGMLTLNFEKRDSSEKNIALRQSEWLPGGLYGFQISSQSIKINQKNFNQLYREAGESTLISLTTQEDEQEKSYPCLIQDIQRDPVSGQIIHVDFYHPSAKKKITTAIPILLEGEAPAVRDFGGTVVRDIKEIEVKGLAIHLPHEIKVDLSILKNIHDRILVKDLVIDQNLELLSEPEGIVAIAMPAENVEEELAKSVDEVTEPIAEEEPEKAEESAE